MNKILEKNQAQNLKDLWPNLELFLHGGVPLAPYKSEFDRLAGKPLNYVDVYSASEGFFAFQDDPADKSLLLLTNNDIFYEFIPLKSLNTPTPEIETIKTVQKNTNYAVLITNSSGLYRYLMGDTLKFTNLHPHKIQLTGRTTYCLNVFGEELIAVNAEDALQIACETHNAEITEYTVAPVFMQGTKKGAHEWFIEFKKAPKSMIAFAKALDEAVQSQNSDYEAKRTSKVLTELKLTPVPSGTFLNWFKSKNKLGGQHKLPRLKNDRSLATEIEEILGGNL
jgi:hypothetical protein